MSSSTSETSVNQSPLEQRIPDGQLFIEYFGPGGARMRKTARKSVPQRQVYGPEPRPASPGVSQVGETGEDHDEDPEEEDPEEIPEDELSDIKSSAGPVHVPYNMQPDEELADYLWVKLRRARREFIDPDDYYLYYLDSVESLYRRQRLLDINLPDPTWIRTTMSFFPNTAFWNRKKISIVEEGPNSDFLEFIDHINVYVREYLDGEE